MVDRRSFIARVAAAGILPATLGAAPATVPGTTHGALTNALVLSGGGARGAFEAGIVWSLARKYGVTDGMRLPPYEIVCGTSIGALNGWFVATGQYASLAELWRTIASQRLIRLKPQFSKIAVESAGVVNRLADALRLLSLSKDERGIAESAPIERWMAREIDVRVPVLVPLVWAVTDLSSQRPEYFYRLPAGVTAPPDYIYDALRLTVGPHVTVREATDELLHVALRASASIPLVFDPVEMPAADGTTTRSYVDGGVASNSPISVARTVAHAVDVVLLDPRTETDALPSAIDVGIAAFNTMQRKILESEFQQAYMSSFVKRELERLSPHALSRLTTDSPLLETFLEHVPATSLAYIRPDKELPVGIGGFDDQVNIQKSFDLGIAAAERGFTPYDWATFEY